MTQTYLEALSRAPPYSLEYGGNSFIGEVFEKVQTFKHQMIAEGSSAIAFAVNGPPVAVNSGAVVSEAVSKVTVKPSRKTAKVLPAVDTGELSGAPPGGERSSNNCQINKR